MIDGDGNRRTSSWFTPAQFAGRMVIDRELRQVVFFSLGVPDQSANVDVNIADGNGGISADIGRVPCMKLEGGALPANAFATDTKQITESSALNALERKFGRAHRRG